MRRYSTGFWLKRRPQQGLDGVDTERMPVTGYCFRGTCALEVVRAGPMAIRVTAGPEILKIRRETVAHPTRLYKTSMNQAAFLMREVDKVRAELSPTALVYNIRRVINLIGVHTPIPAVPACVTSLYRPVRRGFPHGLERFWAKNRLSQTSRVDRIRKARQIQRVPVVATSMSSQHVFA
ncbi:hypothetical protein [uncultured Sphingomonas sp.]|uniref:hypothetical protein n=1 Tax=uncultured Sphingomonas sp. TaxID=158754 RepID=UPI00258412B3|nr:hypothetical protein [uncultured Sphingomonas sp.]